MPLPTNGTASGAHGKNDSVQTRVSNTSSSLYPQSTYTIAPSFISPRLPVGRIEDDDDDDHGIDSVDSDSPVSEQYDGDDVSYRLRLLVSNSYFLPPAHSKPSSSDLTLPLKPPKTFSRAGTPTFLDLFRLGKSRSRPSTASSSTTAVESLGPMLRTTSDSATVPGYTLRSQAPARAPKLGGDPTGRVVVVREIMEDLITAAKEAEQDMKVREWRTSQILMDGFPDVIDPTDAVDLPPPSAGYPFAVQSTATHGLGVQESVGAADLADRLPPPGTPHGSSILTADDAWRKALLRAAVGHSLNNSPAESMFSGTAGFTSPISSPTPGRTAKTAVCLSPVAGPSKLKPTLDRRIISQLVLEQDEDSSNDVNGNIPKDESPTRPRGLSTPESHTRTSSYLPRRAETPAALHAPLAPPPRTPHSTSHYDLSAVHRQSALALPSIAVRKAHSSPTLSDSYESGPSSPRHTLNMSQTPMLPSNLHFMHESMSSTSSHYTDAEREQTRPSMTLSVFANTDSNRPSFYDRDHPSPSMSAFQDVRYGQYSAHSPCTESGLGHSSPVSHDSSGPRFSTMSPPPRASTSLSTVPLFPPPRTSSLHYKVITTSATPSPTSSLFSTGSIIPHTPQATSSTLPQLSPPLASRRGSAGPAPLLLNVNVPHAPLTVHSAPPPASPASFFDNIHDGLGDLDSDGSGDEDDEQGHVDMYSNNELNLTSVLEPPRPRALSSTQPPRSPGSGTPFTFARFGNQSTPNVACQVSSPLAPPFSPSLPRFKINSSPKPPSVNHQPISNQPISNIPPRGSFFSSKRKVAKSPKKSPLDFVQPPPLPATAEDDSYNFFRIPPMLEPGKPVDTRSMLSSQSRNTNQDESLRKLDGLMVQHMEAEKDRIRKIARTFHGVKA